MSENILDFEPNKNHPSNPTWIRSIYNYFYLVMSIIFWIINYNGQIFFHKLNYLKEGSNFEEISNEIDTILYVLIGNLLLILVGLIKEVRLYKKYFIIGFLALIFTIYLLIGPILFYFDD